MNAFSSTLNHWGFLDHSLFLSHLIDGWFGLSAFVAFKHFITFDAENFIKVRIQISFSAKFATIINAGIEVS